MAMMALVLAGCGGSTPSTSGAGGTAATATPDVHASPRTISFRIEPYSGYTVTGTGMTVVKTDGAYTLTVTLHGLTPNAQQRVNIHAGQCGPDEDTSVLINVGIAEADAAGNAMVSNDYRGPYAIPSGGRIVTVHPPTTVNGGVGHIACGQMPA